ncbi:MAG: hypothetical protein H0Z38_04880 [Firmicutes bacterium]|nr:hypothetical protein [Bacillota bacterium]
MSKLDEKNRTLNYISLGLHYGVAGFIAVLAAITFLHSVYIAITEMTSDVLGTSLKVLNTLFFVIILLEVMSTVIQHPQSQDFILKPFLTVGIISTIRHILMLGAQVSLEPHTFSMEHLIDLGLQGVLTLILVTAYWIASKSEVLSSKGK